MSLLDEIKALSKKYKYLLKEDISGPPGINGLHNLIYEVILLYNSAILSGYFVSDNEDHEKILNLLNDFEVKIQKNKKPSHIVDISRLMIWAEGSYIELINKIEAIKFGGKLMLSVPSQFWKQFRNRELNPGDCGLNGDEPIFQYIDILRINVEVALLDLFISSTAENIQNLVSLYDQLESITTKLGANQNTAQEEQHLKAIFYCNATQEKITFLLDIINDVFLEEKINYFFYSELSEPNSPLRSYCFPVTEELKRRSKIFLSNGDLDLTSARKILLEIVREFNQGKDLSLIKYRLLTRSINCGFIRDFNHNQLIERFEKQLVISNGQPLTEGNNEIASENGSTHERKVKYTQYIVNLMHLFLYNNKLSHQVHLNESLVEINNTYEHINDLCLEYSISNHFPHQKISEKYIKEFNELFENHSIMETELDSRYGSLMTKFRKILAEFELSYAWTINNKFIPFLAEQKDCTLTISDQVHEQELFIASAYSSPLYFRKIEATLSGLKSLPVVLEQQLRNQHLSIKMLNSVAEAKSSIKALQEDIEIVKTTKEDIKKLTDEVHVTQTNHKTQIENNEKKQIQILGIFSALVLFVSGNIQIFTKVTSLATGLHFMFIFALSLSLFVSLIWIIFKDRTETIRAKQWIFIIFYFGLLSFAVYSFSFDHEDVKPDTDKSEIQIFKIE